MKKNDVFNYLACNLGTESDEPNIELASSLCKSRNEDAVVTLIEGLKSSSSEVASDCIKVLYELGRRSPDMIADHVDAYCMPSIRNTVQFAKAELGDDSVLYGALALTEKNKKK